MGAHAMLVVYSCFDVTVLACRFFFHIQQSNVSGLTFELANANIPQRLRIVYFSNMHGKKCPYLSKNLSFVPCPVIHVY